MISPTGLDKQKFLAKIVNISYPSILTDLLGAKKNRLIETVLLSTHNICFGWEIRKLNFCYILLTNVLFTWDLSHLCSAPAGIGKGQGASGLQGWVWEGWSPCTGGGVGGQLSCSRVLSWFCLFDLILYVPSTIFQLYRDGSSWVEPVLSFDNCVLLKDHNAVTPVRLEPAALRSRVKHCTTALPVLSWVEHEKSFIT